MSDLDRREFMRRSAWAGVGATAWLGANGGPLWAAPTGGPRPDHRALVAISLDGGADAASLLVPRSAQAYQALAAERPGLLPDRAELRALAAAPAWGWNPVASALADLFDQRRLAIVGNVGPLAQPTSLDQYLARSAELPTGLFGHDAQREAWRNGDAKRSSAWLSSLARAGRAMNEDESTGAYALASPVPLFDGSAGEVGIDVLRYSAANSGPHGSRDATQLAAPSAKVKAALAADPHVEREFPQTPLGRQLAAAVRLIGQSATLGERRQVIHAVQAGWDLHVTNREQLGALWHDLAECVAAFDRALTRRGIADGVVTFTTSEFGRAHRSNGRGLDHGWGAPQLIVGSRVGGGRTYGRLEDPSSVVHVGGGRLLPTTSVTEYAATLAREFGLRPREIARLFPSLERFAMENLAWNGRGRRVTV